MQILDIQVVESVAQAPDYRKGHLIEGHTPQLAKIHKAVIVPKGTENGKSTVDLQIVLMDETGKITGSAVVLITGSIIQTLASGIAGVESRES